MAGRWSDVNVNVRCVFFIGGAGGERYHASRENRGETAKFFFSLSGGGKIFISGDLKNDDDDGAECVGDPGRETESEICKKVIDRRQ